MKYRFLTILIFPVLCFSQLYTDYNHGLEIGTQIFFGGINHSVSSEDSYTLSSSSDWSDIYSEEATPVNFSFGISAIFSKHLWKIISLDAGIKYQMVIEENRYEVLDVGFYESHRYELVRKNHSIPINIGILTEFKIHKNFGIVAKASFEAINNIMSYKTRDIFTDQDDYSNDYNKKDNDLHFNFAPSMFNKLGVQVYPGKAPLSIGIYYTYRLLGDILVSDISIEGNDFSYSDTIKLPKHGIALSVKMYKQKKK